MREIFLIALFSLYCTFGYSINALASKYLTTFGNPEAPIKIVQYFSFNCPHCVQLFQEDFQKIRSKYIDKKQVYWIFHPVPMDLITVQAMDCLEKLTEREKRIFIESLLEVFSVEDESISILYIQKAMELFGKPMRELQDEKYLSGTKAFKEAFLFLKQEEKIGAVPTISINDVLFEKEMPTQKFIDEKLEAILDKKNQIQDF